MNKHHHHGFQGRRHYHHHGCNQHHHPHNKGVPASGYSPVQANREVAAFPPTSVIDNSGSRSWFNNIPYKRVFSIALEITYLQFLWETEYLDSKGGLSSPWGGCQWNLWLCIGGESFGGWFGSYDEAVLVRKRRPFYILLGCGNTGQRDWGNNLWGCWYHIPHFWWCYFSSWNWCKEWWGVVYFLLGYLIYYEVSIRRFKIAFTPQ